MQAEILYVSKGERDRYVHLQQLQGHIVSSRCQLEGEELTAKALSDENTACKPKIVATSLMFQGSCRKAFRKKKKLFANKQFENDSSLTHDRLESDCCRVESFLLRDG